VVELGKNCFKDGGNLLEKIKLSDNIKVIPSITFRFRKLTTINLPASLEEIHESAFSTCIELNNLIIPDSLTSVKFFSMSGNVKTNNDAFKMCSKLPIATRQRIEGLGYTGEF
jgi:hypothetical protein